MRKQVHTPYQTHLNAFSIGAGVDMELACFDA